jgi:hypothetical protein
MTSNLLTSLHRWAWRQDENFITDAFAFLLRRLLTDDEPVGIGLVRYITGDRFPDASDATTIRVRTQVTVAQGRPDIEISSSNHLVYIEAKVESGFGELQLERYLAALDARMPPQSTTLVVLSRYPAEIPSTTCDRVIARRWHQVAHRLVEIRDRKLIKGDVNNFLVDQLIGFFVARNITMERVGPELVSGVRAFRSLIAMVSEALSARHLTTADTFGRKWAGYYFDQKKQEFFLGAYYDRPHVLVFETYKFPVIPDAAEKLGFGKMGPGRWENELDLNSEEVGFFDSNQQHQFQMVEQFLADSIEATRTIRQEQMI